MAESYGGVAILQFRQWRLAWNEHEEMCQMQGRVLLHQGLPDSCLGGAQGILQANRK